MIPPGGDGSPPANDQSMFGGAAPCLARNPLGRQPFGKGAKSGGLGQCTLGVLAPGEQTLVLGQLDGGLLASACVVSSRVFQAAADGGHLRDEGWQIWWCGGA